MLKYFRDSMGVVEVHRLELVGKKKQPVLLKNEMALIRHAGNDDFALIDGVFADAFIGYVDLDIDIKKTDTLVWQNEKYVVKNILKKVEYKKLILNRECR